MNALLLPSRSRGPNLVLKFYSLAALAWQGLLPQLQPGISLLYPLSSEVCLEKHKFYVQIHKTRQANLPLSLILAVTLKALPKDSVGENGECRPGLSCS